ncbi:hypothetical protein HJFPF1_10222 [Paramyrothecium foliicola]|nr:hypothetical protein HJFPF1_10222 [Paramyrothecium foliicola]
MADVCLEHRSLPHQSASGSVYMENSIFSVDAQKKITYPACAVHESMTSSIKAHVFENSGRASPASHDVFTYFHALPAELRLKVWSYAVPRRRILKVRLRNRVLSDTLLERQGVLRPPSHAEERYGVVVDGYQTINKLFRINRESRDVALAFYRVQFPCWYINGATTRDTRMTPGTMYFNPEFDCLCIRNDTGQVIDFIHDLKTVHDPRRVGLLSLALDNNGLKGDEGLCKTNPAMLSVAIRTSFQETLRQLRQVFFIHLQSTGRHVFGFSSGAQSSEMHQNMAFPIMGMALNFDRLRPDPRPIERDLGKVFLDRDPREMVHAWRQLLHSWIGASPTKLEERILIAFSGTIPTIFTSEDAQEWFQREERAWITQNSRHGGFNELASYGSLTTQTAFGFWLFPINAFGPLPAPRQRLWPVSQHYWDLTAFRPDLGVVELPRRR